ncbi:MAG: OmpA family protein, partial [Pseudomonadales bacterium]
MKINKMIQISSALLSIASAPVVLALLPTDEASMTEVVGTADYSFTNDTGTLVFDADNSMVAFGDNVSIGQGQTLVVKSVTGDASWTGVIDDRSGVRSVHEGIFAPEMRVFFLNSAGVLTGSGFTVNFNALSGGGDSVLFSTHNINPELLRPATGDVQYQFSSPLNGNAIDIGGLQVNGDGANVLLLADSINIDGAVNVPDGRFEALSAGEADVVFSVNDMMMVRAPLATAGIAAEGIRVASTGVVEANQIYLAASVDDPLSLALNNSGVLRATGVTVNQQGQVTLVSQGARLLNTGTIDSRDTINGDGNVSLAANLVALGGEVQAGAAKLQIEVGDAQSGTGGEFRLLSNANVTAASAELAGVGDINTLSGLANYQVNGSNSGTAGWQGVGGNDWSNNDALTFSGFSRLLAREGLQHVLRIDVGGTLENASNTALLRGSRQDDQFDIAGSVQQVEGAGGDDLFVMQGGVVTGLLDGGGGIDRLENVFNATRSGPLAPDGEGINGQSDFVDWVNIQSISIRQVPPPVGLPDLTALQAQQLSFVNVSNVTAASLGAIGGAAEPSLPCGSSGGAAASIAGDFSASDDPCFDEQRLKQFQHLISSLIHFDNDSAVVKPEFATRLSEVSSFFLGSREFRRIQIAAHTDDNASEPYNLALSQRRARSTAMYM